jgi:hypothetical protein
MLDNSQLSTLTINHVSAVADRAKEDQLSTTAVNPAKSSTSVYSTLNHQPLRMSLDDDRNWVAKIYEQRAETIDADRNVTCFFLKDYQEICRYMRTIGYGLKGKAESVEKQVARELEIGRYCSLRTTVRGRQSTQDIALFIYHDPAAVLSGSGLVVVSFDTGGELAELFADAWFEKIDRTIRR